MEEEGYEEFDLDLLEEQVELDDYKQTKEEEVRLMNKAMDLRLQHLEAQKKAHQKPPKIDDDLETNSGLLIRSGSRQI